MRTIARWTCVALAGTFFVAAAPAIADTYTVNSTTDGVDAAPGNGICATATGACTLRAAVQEANAHVGADVISLPAGLYLLSLAGSGEDLAATGDLDVTEALEVNGAGRDSTIIDGLSADRIFQSGATTLALRDLTLRHGFFAGPGGGLFQNVGTVTIERVLFASNFSTTGGAIDQAGGALTITDSTFESNFSSGGPGGAVLLAGTGALTIMGTTFTGNGAVGSDAGAVASTTSGPVTVTNSTFSNNFANNVGALLASSGSAFSLDGSTFEGNQATSTYGGFFYFGPGNAVVTNTKGLGNFSAEIGAGFLNCAGTVQVSGSEFSDNVTLAGSGGGLFAAGGAGITIANTAFRRNAGGTGPGGGLDCVAGAGTLTLTDVEASDNAAAGGGGMYLLVPTITLTRVQVLRNGVGAGAGQGGGLFLAPSTVATISDSTFDGNISGAAGGGIYFSAPAAVTITNSTISNNRAAGVAPGGGAFLSSTMGTLTNVTFSGNVSDLVGGGAVVNGAFTLRNVTLADNTAPTGSALFNSSGTLTVGSSIIAGSAASHCAGSPITSGDFNIDSNGTCGLIGGNDRNNVDPQLGPLADNGGPTFTQLPAATSPAIDGGNPTGCPATDQRGETRPADGNGDGSAVCDAGAVEFLDLCPTAPAKTLPGICGCGVADTDAALPNGVADCLINGELKARLARAKTIVAGLTGDPSEAAAETELADIADGLGTYVKQFKAQLVLADPKAKLDKLAKKTKKPVKKVTKAKAGKKLDKAKTKATAALDNLDRAVAAQ